MASMNSVNRVGTIEVDLSNIEKEIRGIIHEYIGKNLEDFNLKDWLKTRIDKKIENIIDKITEKKVYRFLEEARIEVPSKNRYQEKITINDYIIRVIHDFAIEKAAKMLEGMIITIKDGKNE